MPTLILFATLKDIKYYDDVKKDLYSQLPGKTQFFS
jgi:hypothetical protein